MREKILSLVLQYEAAVRQVAFIKTQLHNHLILFKVMEIDYRFGGSSTNAYLSAIEKQTKLENQFDDDSGLLARLIGRLIEYLAKRMYPESWCSIAFG